MNHSNAFWCAILLAGLLTQAGCLRPKRAGDPTRFYVLSAIPAEGVANSSASADRELGLGIGPVEIPSYLFDSRIVFRRGTNELSYTEGHRWAERLDKGIQRVLGANLALLMPSDRIVLSAWQRPAVQAELYVSVERLECDDRGKAVLDARWRLAIPGGERTLLTRHSHIVREASVSSRKVEGAVSELSLAIADLSREIAALLPGVLAESRIPERFPTH